VRSHLHIPSLVCPAGAVEGQLFRAQRVAVRIPTASEPGMSSSEGESYECLLCLDDVRDISSTPIWQCSEGHMQCDSCYNERGGASAVRCEHEQSSVICEIV